MENTNKKGETLQTTDNVGVTDLQTYPLVAHWTNYGRFDGRFDGLNHQIYNKCRRTE